MDGEAELERQTSVGSNGRGTTISSSAAPKENKDLSRVGFSQRSSYDRQSSFGSSLYVPLMIDVRSLEKGCR